MSNNYRNFLLSPTTTTASATAAKLRQQLAMSASGLPGTSASIRERGDSNCGHSQQQSSRQRSLPSGHAEYGQQQQSQVANYCQLQIQRDGSGKQQQRKQTVDALQATPLSQPAPFIECQSGYTSCASSCRTRERCANLQEDEVVRRGQQHVERQHYNWQANNNGGAECMGSDAKRQQQRSRQHQQQEPEQQHTSSQAQHTIIQHSHSNDNNHTDKQNQYYIACDENGHNKDYCQRTNFGTKYWKQTSGNNCAGSSCDQQELEPLTKQMAKLLSKRSGTGGGGSQSTSVANQQMNDKPQVEYEDTEDYQYADQLRKSHFNQFNQQKVDHKVAPSQQQQQYLNLSQGRTNYTNPVTTLGSDLQQIHQNKQQHVVGQRNIKDETTATSSPLPSTTKQLNNNKGEQRSLHVNFNRRSSQLNASDDEDGSETRKKKYLTAKYGQQQMNLIKKRLKIETWLHEKLQELAKQSKTITPEELDEIDIDLDELLDMEDDTMRRHWLHRTLKPLSDLPAQSIESFIDDVLDKSKLL